MSSAATLSDLNMQHVIVVSDLHLVDNPGESSLQGPGKARLLAFFRSVVALAKTEPVHLVLNGDTVDFLCGPEAAPFLSDPQAACSRLQQIFQDNAKIFDALTDLLDEPRARLTITLGNHDIELGYTETMRLLFQRLDPAGRNRSRLDLRHGDELLTLGPVLIEHGNHYDRWNRVDSAALRRLSWPGAAGSQGAVGFPVVPGSRLVVEVMNELKSALPFVDLLKPEDDAVLPLLAVLRPEIIDKLQQIVNYFKTALARDARRIARELKDVLGNASASEAEDLATIRRADESLALAYSLSGRGELGNASMATAFREFLKIWTTEKFTDKRLYHLTRLLTSLRYLHRLSPNHFDTAVEEAEYLNAARRHILRGYRYVIFGHTHLPKRVKLSEGGVYLNTGTWTDIMRLPTEIFGSDEESAFLSLAHFVDKLEQGETPGRYQYPVFAWLRGVFGAEPNVDLFCYNASEVCDLNAAAVRLTDGPLERMQELLS